VEEQEVEAVLTEPLEAALGGHPQVAAVLVWTPKRRVGEPREAARSLALALIEVVADRPDQAEGVTVQPLHGAADERVRLALAVGVGRHHGVDPVAGPQERLEPLGLDCLAEAQVAPPAPASDRLLPRRRHAPTVASACRVRTSCP
jgi:hypothetical protein